MFYVYTYAVWSPAHGAQPFALLHVRAFAVFLSATRASLTLQRI